MAEARLIDAHAWETADLEWYVEDEKCTDQLLAAQASHGEPFAGPIWDPCCGGGNILKASWRAGLSAWGSDLVQRWDHPSIETGPSFLDRTETLGGARDICMNPPFGRGKLAEAFIRHALALAPGKVAAFVEGRFLFSAGRAKGLYMQHPPDRVWIITPRPSCPPGEWLAQGHKPGGGKQDFAWLVWNEPGRRQGAQRIGWLR